MLNYFFQNCSIRLARIDLQCSQYFHRYIKRRAKSHHGALRVFRSDAPHPQEEYLDCLWQQVKRLRSEMWIEKHIIRPYLAFDSVLCEALQHNLPQMVPPPHHPSTTYPLPQVVFRMFDYTDCPEVDVLLIKTAKNSSFTFCFEF